MAVPRPLLLAVLGLMLVVATFMATRNAHTATEPGKPAAQATAVKPADKPKPAHKAAPPASKPAEKKATSSTADHASTRHTRTVRHQAPVSKPTAVARAIAHHRVVVLAFFQKRGADDSATKTAVADLRHRHLASVFMDSIDHIGRYGTVVGALGIHQAPAIVIIDSHRRARLVEGFVDPESLAQEVSDAHK